LRHDGSVEGQGCHCLRSRIRRTRLGQRQGYGHPVRCQGAHVICVDIGQDAAEETTDIINSEGGSASAYACDVTDSAAVSDLVACVVRENGRIDVLHNNVGYATMGGQIEVDEAAWQRTFDLNVKSCFITCKHLLPHMLERKSGAIVNVSSIAAIRYTGYPYVAKGAVNNFTKGLALQHARTASA
jgi:NAD(P)-dependent dehydrogenase (short-subunit alcohol dehydrogenase family)